MSNLIQYNYKGDFLEAVEQTIRELRGAYAILVIHQDHPDEIIGARLGSPLLLAYNDVGDFYFSSDTQELSGYADKIVYLEE
ncbi:hypothetical protein KA013_03590 [Patescibacteria group bacterium]|nr:hypothetical protein [Patescibacteria group bacterium]